MIQHSQITAAQISDGCSNTYLAGEKYVWPDQYLTGLDGGDDWNMYVGEQDDNTRQVAYIHGTTTYCPPLQDTPGVSNAACFGSAHTNGLHMAFCDGSVQMTNYSIDPEIHRRLGNRYDGLSISSNQR